MLLMVLFTLPCIVVDKYGFHDDAYSTKSIEELVNEYEDDKNSMIAQTEKDNENINEDFYDEQDHWSKTGESMNILYFGPSDSFMRLDAESILHILIHTKSHLIPLSRVLLAWDMVTDGKTAAYLQGRELLAFSSLLNVVPEEDLYYVNFADPSVLNFFAKTNINLQKRKYGILVSGYRRVYGNNWYRNSTLINQLGWLFCGFPPTDFVKITPEVLKEISYDIFNKLDKCSSEQYEVLYNIAIDPDAYGKPYQWASHDLYKLSSLITFVPDEEISSIKLEAMTGITQQIIKIISQDKLQYFSKQQIMRMDPKSRRLFVLRMALKESLDMTDLMKRKAPSNRPPIILLLLTSGFILHATYI